MKISSPLVKSVIVGGFVVLGIIYNYWIWPSMSSGHGPKTVIKAKQAEAKVYIGYMNRAQQAYRLESGSFTTDINALNIGISEQTNSYVYSIIPSANSADRVTHLAIPKQPDIRSYIGEVVTTSRSPYMSVAIVCESKQPSQVAPLIPEFVNDSLVCAPGSQEFK